MFKIVLSKFRTSTVKIIFMSNTTFSVIILISPVPQIPLWRSPIPPSLQNKLRIHQIKIPKPYDNRIKSGSITFNNNKSIIHTTKINSLT